MTAECLERLKQQNMEDYGFGPVAMKKLKVCTECRSPSPSRQQFCSICGHRLPGMTLYDIYKARHKCCPVCDTVLSDGMEYCPQCGTKTKPSVTNTELKEDLS